MALIEANDFSLFYETKGAGALLILIPGFASGAWTWFRQTAELSENFRVITFDPRGIGRSVGGSAVNLSMETFVEDVLWILDDLKIERANVLGASFGGFVAQEFALKHPERVGKLILACTTAGGARHVKPHIEILRSFAPDATLPLGEKIRRFIRPAFTDEFNEKNADEVENVCRMRERNVVSDAAYAAQLRAAFTLDTEENLGALRHATLVVTGDRDRVVPLENSLNLARKIPNARLEIVAGGSHLFFIENYREFNSIIKKWLQNS